MRPLVGEYMGCVFMHSTASLFLLVLSIEPEIVRVHISFSAYAAHALASACWADFVYITILFLFAQRAFGGRQILFLEARRII